VRLSRPGLREVVEERRRNGTQIRDLVRGYVLGKGKVEIRRVPMTFERITIDPEKCNGKPCIRNTRIMVKNILGLMAGGYTVERILEAYPQLESEDVVEALQYASAVIDEDKHIPRAS